MPDNEFYVGYGEKAPRGIIARTKLAVILVGIAALGAGALFVTSQNTFGSGIFEFGNPREFEGVVRTEPVPHLESEAGDAPDALLVAPFKHGADSLIAGHDGARVKLEGTLIEQNGERMLEVVPGSIEAKGTDVAPATVEPLGTVTLVGQIVDSKCWLGVMKPGQGKVHRECAILCIKGGIPPLLYAFDKNGNQMSAILVSAEGKPVNEAVLDLVAIPVRVSGELERRGDLLFLRTDPSTIERVD